MSFFLGGGGGGSAEEETFNSGYVFRDKVSHAVK